MASSSDNGTASSRIKDAPQFDSSPYSGYSNPIVSQFDKGTNGRRYKWSKFMDMLGKLYV